MDTKKWGPSGWVFLHAIAENYDPDIHDAQTFKRFFTDVGGVLPCIHCRNSYQEFSQELLIDPYLKSTGGLAEWMYLIHNKVNKKLRDQGYQVVADPSLESVRKKYQNFKTKNCNKTTSCRSGDQSGAGPLLRSSLGEARRAGPRSLGEARRAEPRSLRKSNKAEKYCLAKTEIGDRCRRKVLTGQKYCYQHH